MLDDQEVIVHVINTASKDSFRPEVPPGYGLHTASLEGVRLLLVWVKDPRSDLVAEFRRGLIETLAEDGFATRLRETLEQMISQQNKISGAKSIL